ncbi:hypothetical protein JOD01_000343 [Brevibacillus fulvus]|uniref:Uncharacterized protein n=1 Tax=Brevibacillus fulvus TaxID=1125967 RepID=A0A938XRW7_9BACL|nr:hypothetical protein [Brevibacillus fulvus]
MSVRGANPFRPAGQTGFLLFNRCGDSNGSIYIGNLIEEMLY